MDRHVVMLSAGMDSVLNLLLSLERGEVVLALTVDYGQRAAAREIERSKEICRRLGVDHRVLEFPWLGEISGAALIVSGGPGEPSWARGSTSEEVDALWIPNRNGLFANVGACFAEALDARFVVMGLNAEEGEIFPDNSIHFLDSVNKALEISTRKSIELVSYTVDWDKERIARELAARGFDFSLLWSCYNGGKEMCGECPSCKRLIASAKRAGIYFHINGMFGGRGR